MSHDSYVHFDAAYLFGALEPGERAAYESHLATCAACRAELDALGDVMRLLNGSDERALDPPSPPATLLPALLAAAGRDRRRRGVRVAASFAAAACVAILGVFIVSVHWTPLPPARAMSPVVASPVSATVTLRPTDWGTQISLACWYRAGTHPQPGYSYALKIKDRDGRTYSLGTWRLGPHKHLSFTSGTSLAADRIDRISITDSDGSELLALDNR